MAFRRLVDHYIEDNLLHVYFEITDDSRILYPDLMMTLLLYYSDGHGFDPKIRH